MERREFLGAVAAATGIAGITEVQALEIDERDIAIVLKTPHRLSEDACKNIRVKWRKMFKGTKADGIPMILLEEGMSIETVRLPKQGESHAT